MKLEQATRILTACAAAPKKIEAFDRLAKRLGIPSNTVYAWWRNKNIPHWRLGAFDKLKVRK
jgi:excisionase family DNA binding protein